MPKRTELIRNDHEFTPHECNNTFLASKIVNTDFLPGTRIDHHLRLARSQSGSFKSKYSRTNALFGQCKLKAQNIHINLVYWKKTLPKALRIQALTALTSNFGLVGLVWWVWFGRFGLVGLVW